MTRPRLWKYLLAGLLLVPIVAGLVLYFYGIEDVLMRYERGRLGLLGWLALPIALALAAFVGRSWVNDRAEESAQAEAARRAEVQRAAEAEALKTREFALEVRLLGMSVDKLRQQNVWEEVKKVDPFTMIRSRRPEDYPWSAGEKSMNAGKRGLDALEHAVAYAPAYWGIPTFMASTPVTKRRFYRDGKLIATIGIESWQTVGLHWTLFAPTARRMVEHPDALLADVFAFFEQNPDAPFVFLIADEGDATRDEGLERTDNPLLRDGQHLPKYTDTTVGFILARRERAEWLRPFAVEDKQLEQALLERYAEVQKKNGGGAPEAADWLALLRDYAAAQPWMKRPQAAKMAGFKPTPWIGQPWTHDQLVWWDRLPSLGFIHRPQFASFKSEDGKAMTRPERSAAFKSAWKAALETVPGGATPERVFYATGPEAARVGLLTDAMTEIGPQRALFDNAETIDFDKKLGDTGAATLFAQLGLGVIASYRDGGVTAAVNLRDPDGATIVMVRPPPAENRKGHPAGGDVFRYGIRR